MSVTPFPVEFPIASIQELIRLVRLGLIFDEVGTFGLHAWNVVGYGLGIVLPDVPPPLPAALDPVVLKELRDGLAAQAPTIQLRSEATSPPIEDTAESKPAAVPTWLLLVVQLLIQFLDALLNKTPAP
jgi:hypothetical protein